MAMSLDSIPNSPPNIRSLTPSIDMLKRYALNLSPKGLIRLQFIVRQLMPPVQFFCV